MKQASIRVGMICETYVGGELARVVVVREHADSIRWGIRKGGRTTFDVRRVDGESLLPKPRTAAALREV